MRSATYLAAVACLLLLAQQSSAQAPVKCKKAERPYVFDLHKDAFSVKWEVGEVKLAYANHANGPWSNVGEHGWLRINVGHSFPIHKHGLDGSEFIYVLNGTGTHEVMAPGMTKPLTQAMYPGASSFLPPGGIHRVANTGDEPFEMIVFTSASFTPMYVYEDWPASTDAPGMQVPVAPWEASCPPGQELNEEL